MCNAALKDAFPKLLFLASLLAIGYAYGYISHRWELFPFTFASKAEDALTELIVEAGDELPFQYARTRQSDTIVRHRPETMAPGLTLITRVGRDNRLLAEVLMADGTVVHQWALDWFDLWPQPTHLPDNLKPREPPGTHIHGVALMDDGGLIFNFEQLGLARVDINSRAIWRLPYRTHHSIYRAESGNLWIPGMITHEEKPTGSLGYYYPPYDEYTILEVAPEDGRILREISLFDIFLQNDLQGLLYLSSLKLHPESYGDTLHLNDVELFPERLQPGFFQPGDVMVSLRNTNTVLVFELETGKKKFVSIGPFVRQHDPDFVNGETISIFDNNDSAPADTGVQSRILLQKAPSGDFTVAYQGTAENPFFTDLLGKHEWQENGNLLITDSRNGRVFEVDSSGDLLWEYFNIVEPGIVGLVETAQRLSERYSAEFFAEQRNNHAEADPLADIGLSKPSDSQTQSHPSE